MVKQYIKKVTVIDEKSSAEARAERLKRLRNLANLSRKEMCEDNDININTLKGWEIARYGGLPKDGAEKIVNRVKHEGVIASVDWLLHEIGPGPYIIPDFHKSQTINPIDEIETSETNEITSITEELLLFRKYHKNAAEFTVLDDSMEPTFKIGDRVAGIKYNGETIASALGQDCIVLLKNGQTLLRNVQQGTQANCFNLVCSNPQIPTIADTEIISAAPIMRHYRLNNV